MRLVITFLLFLFGLTSFAQNQPQDTEPKKEINELRLNLNNDGSHYVKATFSNQIWFRFTQNNPGSTVLGNEVNNSFDVGLRRTRFQLWSQLSDRVFFYMQFGQNSFNFLSGQNSTNTGNRKFQTFIHDAVGEYLVTKGSRKLLLGGGLTITNGLSRFTQPSVSTIMTMDVPVFAQATVDQIDQFSRKLSVYARGQLGKFDYRIVMSDPFPVSSNGTTPPPISANSTFALQGHHKQYQGFFIYNFFDKEPHTTPYMAGTYLGTKKVFNLEGGFIAQKDAMWTTDGVTTDYHNMNLWSVAAFYDAPVNTEKGTALSAYAGYFNYDYGPGYLRNNGIMNPANGVNANGTFNGPGNSFPMYGTGNALYAQLGYLFKKDLMGEDNGTLMPYASVMSAQWDRLQDSMNVWDIGINWFLKGHMSKFSLDYQNRPMFISNADGNLVTNGTKGQVVLQYQIAF